ncbi:restriction endonuclease subunit S [Lactobacillus delbrueckii]|nr:restriction endonuclease subunit S [Lactobacillus delbrueckii]MCD5559387.1 restriction endonuclease subunit S [Lactobacillus delbrueckii subsp. lactis]MCD5590313.1 restriction endonuclease subunit S [Lactobacillus delbrueckii subsp. lactis]MCD5594404.1 restriction endonuclease subunit S [Lactobacillus delbrueckii subsp. lactis]
MKQIPWSSLSARSCRNRRKGCNFAWEQRKLGDVCEPITDSIDTQKYPNEVFAEYSMPAFDASMKPDIVLGSSMNSVRKIITRPCLLVNKLNVRKKRIWYVKKPNKNAVCSAEFIPLYSDTVDLTFLNQVAKSETFTRYLENHSSGSSNSQKRITPRSLMLSKLHIPTIEEQKLIGKIFESLDHTITLHEEKKRQLERLKSALLKKMFADKSGYPAVRFEGFGGKWDQCKLGNVGTFRGGFGFPENEQGNIDGIAFYKVSDMNDSCNTLTMRKASNYVTSSQISKNKWKPILNQNIIFAKVGAAVYLERKRKAMGPFLLDNNMMAFQPKDADIDYIYYVFQRLRISKHAQVGTLPSLNASELRNITIYIPSLNEQKAVADLMVSLDHTIILYDFKLELLKKLKSSLLQHMFI